MSPQYCAHTRPSSPSQNESPLSTVDGRCAVNSCEASLGVNVTSPTLFRRYAFGSRLLPSCDSHCIARAVVYRSLLSAEDRGPQVRKCRFHIQVQRISRSSGSAILFDLAEVLSAGGVRAGGRGDGRERAVRVLGASGSVFRGERGVRCGVPVEGKLRRTQGRLSRSLLKERPSIRQNFRPMRRQNASGASC